MAREKFRQGAATEQSFRSLPLTETAVRLSWACAGRAAPAAARRTSTAGTQPRVRMSVSSYLKARGGVREPDKFVVLPAILLLPQVSMTPVPRIFRPVPFWVAMVL